MCGAVGTPLTRSGTAEPVRPLERTSAMEDEAGRDDGIGALDDLSRDEGPARPIGARDPDDDVSRDDVSQDADELTSGGPRAPGTREVPARTAALLPASKQRPAPEPRKPPPNSRAEDAVGRVLGSYKLLEVIGRGGMGRVYRAEHIRLGRHVALKLLKPEYAVKRDAVARFFQEAKAVNKIRHRNIVEVTDYVELADGTTFIIMELLEGSSLGKALRTNGPMDAARLLAILIQVSDALEAAHSVGIVHRDLKPDNIFLIQEDSGEVAKLLDFGVAKLLAADDDSSQDEGWQTAAGSVVGTPAYMSPEQAGGLDVDGRSDVYSLGAIMYELFCGQPLFRGRSFGDFVVKHMSEPVVPPRSTPGGAAMAPELEQIILRCVMKKPQDRYATVGELRDRLYQHLASIDSGLGLALASPRVSGIRKAQNSGPVRIPQASTPPPFVPAPSGDALPSVPGASQAAAAANGARTPTPELEAEHPSSNGLDTRMVLGDLQGSQPSGDRRKPRTTWPLWTAGAAAVAAGAFWFATGAGRDPVIAPEPYAASAAAPDVAVAPVPPEPEPSAPAPVKLAVRTDPVGADVFVYGSDDSQCRTPCELTIDPRDGGSTVRRVFTLKRPGFQDYQLEVPLQGAPPPDAFVILMPEGETDVPVGPPAPVAVPTPAPTPPVAAEEDPGEKPSKGRDRGDSKASRDEGSEPAGEDRPDSKPDGKDTKAEAPPVDPPPVEPAKVEPPPAKKKDRIDRADTLDPFGKK